MPMMATLAAVREAQVEGEGEGWMQACTLADLQAKGALTLGGRGRNVYVVVSTQDWAKRPVPDALRGALAP